MHSEIRFRSAITSPSSDVLYSLNSKSSNLKLIFNYTVLVVSLLVLHVILVEVACLG
jgi:hypothetical protein